MTTNHQDALTKALESAAELIVRDVCEMDPANPELNDTICIDVSDLLIIVKRHLSALPADVSTQSTDQRDVSINGGEIDMFHAWFVEHETEFGPNEYTRADMLKSYLAGRSEITAPQDAQERDEYVDPESFTVFTLTTAQPSDKPEGEEKRKFELTPEMKEALAKAAETRAQVAGIPNGSIMFINYGDQPEDTSELDCPHCGGSGHKGDVKLEGKAEQHKCSSDGGICGAGGYCDDCPHICSLQSTEQKG